MSDAPSILRISDEGDLQFLARSGTLSTNAIAARFCVGNSTIRTSMAMWEKKGYVEKERRAGRSFWTVTSAGREAASRLDRLDTYRRLSLPTLG